MSEMQVDGEALQAMLAMVLKSIGEPVVVLKSDVVFEEGKMIDMQETDDAFIFSWGDAK